MKEKFEDRKLTGKFRVKLERDDHDCGKYWEGDKQYLINSIIEVIEDYEEQGYKLTLRQLYYQLVSKNIIPNDNVAYNKLSSLLDDCRYSGIVDWDSIEDRGRIPYTPYFEYSIKDAIRRTIDCYQLDRRIGQDIYVELWSEKDAISNILKNSVIEYTITVGINKGFTSSTAIHEAYERFIEKILNKQKVILLYFGDHDPSGLDMVRDIRDRLEFMMCNGNNREYILNLFPDDDVNEIYPTYDLMYKYNIYDDFIKSLEENGDWEFYKILSIIKELFEVRQIGLTKEQIKFYNLPPNPAKLTDPRAKGYIAKYGDISWEVDALSPNSTDKIIRECLNDIINLEKYNEIIEKEKEDIIKLQEFLKNDN